MLVPVPRRKLEEKKSIKNGDISYFVVPWTRIQSSDTSDTKQDRGSVFNQVKKDKINIVDNN